LGFGFVIGFFGGASSSEEVERTILVCSGVSKPKLNLCAVVSPSRNLNCAPARRLSPQQP
jgi:hypothetical protein